MIDSETVTEANGWKWSFKDLPAKDGSRTISYSISEGAVPGYTATYSGYNVTNTHVPGTVTVAGSKTWDDADDAEGKRPASITINLLANGVKVDSKTVTAADSWSWKWTGLPKYEGGAAISYAINENRVNGYMCSVDGYDLTNTFITPEKKEELPEPIPGKPGAIDRDGDGIISELDDLFDGDVPLGGIDRNGDGVVDELDDMFDEDVPLADVARTRDASVFWYICTILSALGLCIISYQEHKGGKRLMRNKQ